MESKPSPNLFGDFAKVFEQLKLPGLDVAAIVESRRKDIEALMTANRLALEAAQSLGQKQVEMLRHSLTEIRDAITHAGAAKGSEEPAARNSELVQRILQTVLQDMRELSEAAFKAQSDTVAVVNKRIQDNIEEMKALLKPKASHAAETADALPRS